ncbi:MAG TPA: ABC transporter substrate-binding protein [Acetobacteraceae bacterium]|nr:ABC transporter substrate-binding protein [Acetobacteraceae bacterium]
MPTRRSLFLSVPLILVGAAALAADEASAASDFVRQTGDAILNIVNGSGTMAEKRTQLTAIVNNAVDVDGIGRFELGRFWPIATPEQRQTFLSLFRQYLVFNVTGRLGQYKGSNFTIDRSEPLNGDIAVSTTIHTPGQPTADMQWIVSFASGKPQIVDLVAEGTSMRVTQRSDYASVITRGGGENVQALIDALRQQLSRMQGSG